MGRRRASNDFFNPDDGFVQYFPPYTKTKYYSNQLYRVYDRGIGKNEPKNVLIGYIRLPDRESITFDFMPNLKITHIPIFAWAAYSSGKMHFKGEQVYDWVCERVTPPYRQGIEYMLMECGIDEYDPISLFVWADGKFANDHYYIVKCDESQEKAYKQIMEMESFIPTDESKTPDWF